MQHRASDDPELQLLHYNDDDSQAKSRSQTAASSDGWESEPQQYEIIPWYMRSYNRGNMIAFFCFVLVMGSFAIPETAPPLLAIGRGIGHLSQLAKHHAYHAHAHLRGKEHHCMAVQEPLIWKPSMRRASIAVTDDSFKLEKLHKGSRWLVEQPQSDLLTIMTPIFPDSKTLGFLKNQLRTANKHFDFSSVKEWLFVTPEHQIPAMVAFLEQQIALLPCIPESKIRVIADEICAPELRQHELERIAGDSSQYVDGWMKQQLVKLACSFAISTPFYLITDADMFFLHDVGALDLVEQTECTEASGVCDKDKAIAFRALNEMQPPQIGEAQQSWISSSAATLNMSVPKGRYRTMGVTPQILSRSITDRLARYIQHKLTDKATKQTWRAYLLQHIAVYLRQPPEKRPVGMSAWTEYDLYWEFARNKVLWDKYHKHAVLQRDAVNVWLPEQYPTWDPCLPPVHEDHPGFWAIVQSTSRVTADQIWVKLEPCMDI